VSLAREPRPWVIELFAILLILGVSLVLPDITMCELGYHRTSAISRCSSINNMSEGTLLLRDVTTPSCRSRNR
jgi:hypothetical protein